MNIISNHDGWMMTMARLSSEQAVEKLNKLAANEYAKVNQLYFAKITITTNVCKTLTRVLSNPEKKWVQIKFVDCPYTKEPHLEPSVNDWEELEFALKVEKLVLQTTCRFRADECFFPISSISKVKYLHICTHTMTQDIANELKEGLTKTKTLVELSFTGSRRLFKERSVLQSIATGLSKNTSIETLDLSDIYGDDEHMSALLAVLSNSSTLLKLDLSNNLIGHQTINTLANTLLPTCKGLKDLDLHSQKCRVNMSILAPSLSLSNVRKLVLSNTQLEDEDINALADALIQPTVKISHLDLENNRRVTNNALLYLVEKLPNVKYLRHLNIRKMTGDKSKEVLKAIAKNIRDNTHLLFLRIDYFVCVEQTEIKNLGLGLGDRGGRRVLEENMPLTTLPNILERANGMTYCPNAPADRIYTMIRNTPELWSAMIN